MNSLIGFWPSSVFLASRSPEQWILTSLSNYCPSAKRKVCIICFQQKDSNLIFNFYLFHHIDFSEASETTKGPSPLVKIGNTTITPLVRKEETVQIADDESERDEAEGDESDLDETNETDEEVVDKGQPVKV